MKLSNAMLLGLSAVKMEQGNWNTCALGVAATVVGIPSEITGVIFGVQYEARKRYLSMAKVWPWLDAPDPTPIEEGDDLMDSIYRRFDSSVCAGHMSMDELIAYVASIEPDCGDCNRFICVCEMVRQATAISSHIEQIIA